MAITPKNLVKNIISPSKKSKSGYATWGDTIATWGDTDFSWGSPFATMVNMAKSQAEFLATEALDYLMTEDDDYLIVRGGGFRNLTKN